MRANKVEEKDKQCGKLNAPIADNGMRNLDIKGGFKYETDIPK